MGTSRSAKAASHDRILDIAAARIRRDGIGSLAVAEIMKEAGLTHGGFYRHFGSREQLVAEAAQPALTQGSAWTIAAASSAGSGIRRARRRLPQHVAPGPSRVRLRRGRRRRRCRPR